MRNFFRQMSNVIGLFLGLCLAGSFLGRLHPLGDSLQVIMVSAAALGFLYWFRPLRHIELIWVPVLATFILITAGYDRTRSTGPSGPYSVYQKNVWAGHQNLRLVADDILEQAPDFVMLQEMSTPNRQLLQILKDAYPHQHLCTFTAWSGVAVLSRHPQVAGQKKCSTWRGFAAMQVTTPDGKVWLVSQHLFWPFPKLQSQQLDRILPKLSELNGSVILGGDFNMQPGTRVERMVAKATGTQGLRPVFPTFHIAHKIPVSIDQILARCGTVTRRPKLGSDHHGLLAKVGFNAVTCAD